MELELVTDDRKLPERSVEDRFALAGVVLQDVAEHGHEHEQQREQRHECVVGNQRAEFAGLVVAELLDHGRHEAHPALALLPAVEVVQAIGEAHRGDLFASPSRGPARPAPANWEGGVRAPALDTPLCLPDTRIEYEGRAARAPSAGAQGGGAIPARRSRSLPARGASCCCVCTAIDCAGRTSRTATARRRSSSSRTCAAAAAFTVVRTSPTSSSSGSS